MMSAWMCSPTLRVLQCLQPLSSLSGPFPAASYPHLHTAISCYTQTQRSREQSGGREEERGGLRFYLRRGDASCGRPVCSLAVPRNDLREHPSGITQDIEKPMAALGEEGFPRRREVKEEGEDRRVSSRQKKETTKPEASHTASRL